MEITEIRVHLRDEEKLKAFVTVTFDSCFVVCNMKIIQGTKGLLLCMPSRRLPDGTYKDVAHPINAEFRKVLEDRILAAYETEQRRQGQAVPAAAAHGGGGPR